MISTSKKIIVIGGGSWGTALCKILSDAGNQISWYMRNPEACAQFNETGINSKYLPNTKLDTSKVKALHSFHVNAEEADILIIAVPAAFAEKSLPLVRTEKLTNKIVISAAKGMLPENHKTLTEYLEENIGIQSLNLFFIGGPCHAEEAAEEKRSYLTLAGSNEKLGSELAKLFNTNYTSCEFHNELRVVEYAAVLKNIYAVGMGIAHGLGYGDNFQAVLAANSWREAELFLNKTFPNSPINLNDSSCLGDLLVTCYSMHSRNRRFGKLIGEGVSTKEIIEQMNMVAEGYYAVQSFEARYGRALPYLPVVNCVFQIIKENKKAKDAFKELESLLK